jgi:hypothetical protein
VALSAVAAVAGALAVAGCGAVAVKSPAVKPAGGSTKTVSHQAASVPVRGVFASVWPKVGATSSSTVTQRVTSTNTGKPCTGSKPGTSPGTLSRCTIISLAKPGATGPPTAFGTPLDQIPTTPAGLRAFCQRTGARVAPNRGLAGTFARSCVILVTAMRRPAANSH